HSAIAEHGDLADNPPAAFVSMPPWSARKAHGCGGGGRRGGLGACQLADVEQARIRVRRRAQRSQGLLFSGGSEAWPCGAAAVGALLMQLPVARLTARSSR